MKKINDKAAINKTNPFKVYLEMTRLVSKAFFRNPRGPLFMYIVPMFFEALFYQLYKSQSGNSILASYVILPCFTILTSLTPAIIEWKNSVFLKRIEGSGIKRTMFLYSLWTSYLLLSYTAFCTQFLFAIALTKGKFIEVFKGVNVGLLFLSITLVSVTCISIATFIGGLINTEGAGHGIIMMIYFLSIFLSGLMIPAYIIEGSKTMRIICYFIPTKYAISVYLYTILHNSQEYWLYSSDATKTSDFSTILVPIIGSILITAAMFVSTLFTFKSTAKK